MSQHELNREVSRATGESVSTIAGMGFVELRPIPFERKPLTYGVTSRRDFGIDIPSAGHVGIAAHPRPGFAIRATPIRAVARIAKPGRG